MVDAAWQQYIDQIIHKLDFETNEWITENICSAAAIYGQDGAPWAYSPNFPELKEYEHELEEAPGQIKKVLVNELNAAVAAGNGNRQPTEAGIRLGNEKYMFQVHEEDRGVTTLKRRGGGGAAIGNTTTGVVIAFYEKDAVDSKGMVQTGAAVADQVAVMAAYLKEQGY